MSYVEDDSIPEVGRTVVYTAHGPNLRNTAQAHFFGTDRGGGGVGMKPAYPGRITRLEFTGTITTGHASAVLTVTVWKNTVATVVFETTKSMNETPDLDFILEQSEAGGDVVDSNTFETTDDWGIVAALDTGTAVIENIGVMMEVVYDDVDE